MHHRLLALVAAAGLALWASAAQADTYQPAPILFATDSDDLAPIPVPRTRADLFVTPDLVEQVELGRPPLPVAPWSFWTCSPQVTGLYIDTGGGSGIVVPALSCTAPGFPFGTPGATVTVPIDQVINGAPPPLPVGTVIPLIP